MPAQQDSHVHKAKESRTLYYSEVAPGRGVSVESGWLVPENKMVWAILRIIEARRMEIDGSWRDDLARLDKNRCDRLQKANK